jgi:hypothetical protein
MRRRRAKKRKPKFLIRDKKREREREKNTANHLDLLFSFEPFSLPSFLPSLAFPFLSSCSGRRVRQRFRRYFDTVKQKKASKRAR